MTEETSACPLWKLIEAGVELGEERSIECVNCPVQTCWEELPQNGRIQKFSLDIEKRIKELRRIRGILANAKMFHKENTKA